MHGLGSNAEDMFGLACELTSEFEVICLQAPYSYGPQGFAWFEIAWTEDGISVNEAQYWSAVDMVAEILPQIGGPLTVGGFSQGAMMTVGLMIKYPDLLTDAIVLSGRGLGRSPESFKGRVFQAHGQQDEVIPFREGEELRRSLSVLGDRLEFHEYPMGHTVCEEEIQDLENFLKSEREAILKA